MTAREKHSCEQTITRNGTVEYMKCESQENGIFRIKIKDTWGKVSTDALFCPLCGARSEAMRREVEHT